MVQKHSEPVIAAVPQPAVVVAPSPQAVYKGYVAQAKELQDQLGNLEQKRQSLSNQLHDGSLAGANKAGLETRITEIDKQILEMEKNIFGAEQQVAKAAGVPGAVVEAPRPQDVYRGPPDGAFIVGGLFIVVVLLPISLAFARRIWRRGSAAVAAFPQDLVDRLNRLDHSVDSIAVEVERIGEGQRFVTRVLSENGTGRALAGAAVPIDANARERAKVGREGERG